jgi:hypothetical protein
MLRLTRIAQMTIRLTGLALIVLGILIWTGNAALVGAHMALGLLFVLALLFLAGLGVRARAGMGMVIRTVIWAIFVLIVGMVQTQVLPGSAHIVVRVVHLIIGLVAISIGEMLGGRIKAQETAESRVT